MAEYKLSDFAIAVTLVFMMITTIYLIIGKVQTEYGTSGLSSGDFAAFDKMKNISEQTQNLQNKLDSNETQNTGITDILGRWFSSGYEALRIGFGSVTLTKDMVESGAEKAHIPLQFKLGLIQILLIILFLGIVISTIVKRET